MENILMKDLVPIFVIMLVGYLSGKQGAFTDKNAQSLNKLVLNYALPAALFVSIVKADRAMLFSDLTLLSISLVVIVLCYFASYWGAKKFFKHTKAEASIAGLIGGAPTIGYLGFAVLEPIYGTTPTVGLVVAIVAIIVNAIVIPIALFLLNPSAQNAASGQAMVKVSWMDSALMNALKQPVCWSPILAVVIVLTGFRFPTIFDPTFNLIANANAGVAVFAAGITLSANQLQFNKEIIFNSFMKLLFMPAALLVVGLFFGMNGVKLQMLVLCGALPPVFSGIIIGSRFQTYVRTGTSSLAVSTMLFAITAPFWVWFSRLIAG